MFDTGGSNEEGWNQTPPPPAADRLWRHPSEIAAHAAAAAAVGGSSERPVHRPHRFSLGTVVVASSLGVLAMFGTLAGMGLIAGTTARVTTDDTTVAQSGDVTGTPTSLTSRVPEGVVSVRLTGAGSTTFGAGIVINSKGDVVTTLRTTSNDGASLGSLAIESGTSTWNDATVLGVDSATGLTVLQPSPVRNASRTAAAATTAHVSSPSLGQTVAMVRPGVGAVGAQYREPASTRIISTNVCVDAGGSLAVGLLTLSSSQPAAPAEVGVDAGSGAVTALVVPADDNSEDEMSYAVPADLAVEVGRQIETYGHARHGALAATLSPSGGGSLLVTETTSGSTSSGKAAETLTVGDEILSIDGRQVHTRNDVAGALLGLGDDGSVPVVIRRSNQLRSMAVRVVASQVQGQLASTTTLP